MLHRPQLFLVAALLFAAAANASHFVTGGPNAETRREAPRQKKFVAPFDRMQVLGQLTQQRLDQIRQQQAPVADHSQLNGPLLYSDQEQNQDQHHQQQQQQQSSSSPQGVGTPRVQAVNFDNFQQTGYQSVPYLPEVPAMPHVHTKFMLSSLTKSSTLAADHAIDYVAAFLRSYVSLSVMEPTKRRDTIRQMKAYFVAVGFWIGQIESYGYSHMDALAAKIIWARVVALKMDLSGLHLLSKSIPELRSDIDIVYEKQGAAVLSQKQDGRWGRFMQRLSNGKSYLSSWIPRRVTPQELQAIREQPIDELLKQYTVIDRQEPEHASTSSQPGQNNGNFDFFM